MFNSRRLMLALLALLLVPLALGGPAAPLLAQGSPIPAVLEELKPVTADDGQAAYILRFSPQTPRIDPLNSNPTMPAVIFRTALRAPRVAQALSAKGLVRSARFEIAGADLVLRFDTARSRSFLGGTTTPADQNGHGTHVAGTIAAYDNGIGVIGVSPGARVVAVRVLDRRGSGSNSGVIAGVEYVAANGQAGDVANMSLGGGVSTALDTAVVNAAAGGVKFALAAGNESDNANNHSPARANGPNVYTVSAFANGNTWASFSNYGNPPIDYAEPGVAIKSTWLNGGYNTISGTSMATPHLAGILLARSVPANGGVVSGDPAAPADTIGTR